LVTVPGNVSPLLLIRSVSWTGTTQSDNIPSQEWNIDMNTNIAEIMEKLSSSEDKVRFPAFQEMQRISEEKVDWFSEYKDQLIAKLASENSFQRNIGIILLCNLAKNDANKEYNAFLDVLMPEIDDEKFITQRQYLQNIWKVAVVDPAYEERIVHQLVKEFEDCTHKDHLNLLRLDIITSLCNIMNTLQKEYIKEIIVELIDVETDEKSKKKYKKILAGGQ
jgi:hypothetical protein